MRKKSRTRTSAPIAAKPARTASSPPRILQGKAGRARLPCPSAPQPSSPAWWPASFCCGPTRRSTAEAAVNSPQAAIAVKSALEEAARNGDAEAQFRLGRAALLDTTRGKEGAAEAVAWLRQAATGGHTGAMLQLGKLYRSGVGMPQNYEYAGKWIRSAAEAGDSDAMVELGRLYRGGLGVGADPVQAYVWFNRAAAAMNIDGARERDGIALKLSPEELKSAQAASLAAEEEHAIVLPKKVAQD